MACVHEVSEEYKGKRQEGDRKEGQEQKRDKLVRGVLLAICLHGLYVANAQARPGEIEKKNILTPGFDDFRHR